MPMAYLDGFASSFSLIIVSEIGDKTFFIASLLAMQNPYKLLDIFAGASTALIIMTILSTVIGSFIFSVLSPTITTFLSSLGLIYFAVSLAIALYIDEPGEDEEEEVQKELEMIKNTLENKTTDIDGIKTTENQCQLTSTAEEETEQQWAPQIDTLERTSLLTTTNIDSDDSDHIENDIELGQSTTTTTPTGNIPPMKSTIRRTTTTTKDKLELKSKQFAKVDWGLIWDDFGTFQRQLIHHLTTTMTFLSPLYIQCTILTFIAEWGDRSQLATILLASSKSPLMVTIGCILGHMLCTAIAIFFGKLLSTQLNDKHLQIIAAVLFLFFGVAGLWAVFTGQIDDIPQL